MSARVWPTAGVRASKREPLRIIQTFCIFALEVVTSLYTFFKIHRTIHLNGVNFNIYKLPLDKSGLRKKRKQKLKHTNKHSIVASLSFY